MKFMKLGSKPDTFQADGKCTRHVVSDLATDATIIVGEVKFYLHKFPLLSKSNKLQKLVHKAIDYDNSDEITISDIPGGPKAFEICAKFCYGMTVILNAYNVTAARCAAEYLEMTEDVDRGNLIYKIEIFLEAGIFRSWKDSIIVLQTTKSLLPWSEELKIVGRCIDSISAKTSVDPEMITWSYTHNRKLSAPDKIVEYREKMENVPEDWWVEDLCELEIDMFEPVMSAVKCKGRMNNGVIGEALRYYIARWLPESVESVMAESRGNKHLVETIVFLLPRLNGKIDHCSCSFLLKLLKVAILVEADDSVKEELVRNVGLNLHEASVKDLLIHEVDLVHRIVDLFITDQKRDSEDDRYKEFVLGNGFLLSVGRLIDAYLAEIARDPDLDLTSFMELSELIPESARPIHDGLYKAIDTFLKEHPDLSKPEKKKLCLLMDVRKLTTEASMDAAQNDRLPLRVVVQVLYIEQLRSHAAATEAPSSDTTTTTTATATIATAYDQTKKVENNVGGGGEGAGKKLSKKCRSSKSMRSGGPQLMSSRSRRIFEKLWPGKAESSNKSSEVSSGSSHSPTAKSSGSSTRCRRHSIS
ncbi:PREDICTED: BTB/POZ domain-containing protein NPY1 [Tarenaya hassleriana]|uniref:BTB/POZ domain-containing protein NPY1 n=1 Tax=Tarenaya hassleriana TaxID=28532 RepID=UPI00053C3593|nr:PREDICTED: BTB/POZ domain-containing protein NPY1 [Tarenaya hassleriana]XP_010525902.1 PREDICTED: BTB/POZ domain-containing protein NPY1 [Tarenaya hassleriana]